MQIKIMRRQHGIPVRTAKMKIVSTPNAGEDADRVHLSYFRNVKLLKWFGSFLKI
jgi:hypothetical protein